jgi:hypothetical protein
MERELTRYLRLATWGLPQKKKLEIAKELRGNIEMLRLEYMVQGQNKQEALSLALRDFGAPERVCVGMTKVYTMPVLLRNIGLSLLLSSFGVGALFSSSAQVEGITQLPIPECLQSSQASVQIGEKLFICSVEPYLFLNLQGLKSVLEPQGVQFKEDTAQFRDGSKLYSQLLTFPDSPYTLHLSVSNPVLRPWVSGYMLALSFFSELRNVQMPVMLEGWGKTRLTVGKTTMTFGTPEKPISSELIFGNAIEAFLQEEMFAGERVRRYTAEESVQLQTHFVRIAQAQPNDVFVLLTREAGKENTVIRRLHTLTPSADGRYQVKTAAKSLSFKSVHPDKLQVGYNGNLEATLMKFNGRLDLPSKEALTVLDPSQFTVQK